jgi:hypothetical protein
MAEGTKACTKCGEVKPLSAFSPRPQRKCGVQAQCKACSNAYHRAYYQANRALVKERTAEYRYNRRRQYQAYSEAFRKRNRIFIDTFHTPCVACGESRRPTLDFHHVDPATKRWEMTKLPSLSKENIAAELKKVVSLCSNCHRLLHAGDADIHAAAMAAFNARNREVA